MIAAILSPTITGNIWLCAIAASEWRRNGALS